MKSTLLSSIVLVTFMFSCVIPFASAQYAGIGGGGNQTLEEDLKLAKERTWINYYNSASTPHGYLFQNPLLIIIPVIIACGGISFLVFIKSQKSSSNKKNGI